ncbi:MAG: TIM barrel protein [Planctomycetaceae bacterium]
MKHFDGTIGVDCIRAFHLNDSKKEFGSRRDRHEHIGEGTIGVDAFRFLLNDRRFRKTPMYMETPKGERDGEQLDAMNMQTSEG